MFKLITKIIFVGLIILLLEACGTDEGTTNIENEDGGSSEEQSTQGEEAGSLGEQDTSEEEIEQSEDSEVVELPQGESAVPGEALTSDLVTGKSDYTMRDFLVYVLNDVHGFWANVMIQGGLAEPQVNYHFPDPGELATSTCLESDYADQVSAFYCSLDDKIVITNEMATMVWEGQLKLNEDQQSQHLAGDFSVALVVAHEYAHSLQAEIGWIPVQEGQERLVPVKQTELNADCLSGIWANSAYYRNMLEAGDVEEAMRTLADIGDYDYVKPTHHGTPAERTTAFMAGYNSGMTGSCDPYLTDTTYSPES